MVLKSIVIVTLTSPECGVMRIEMTPAVSEAEQASLCLCAIAQYFGCQNFKQTSQRQLWRQNIAH